MLSIEMNNLKSNKNWNKLSPQTKKLSW